MNRIDLAYWRLLRAGLWNDKTELEGFEPLTEKEWKKVVQMAQRSSALGFVTDAIDLLPEDCTPGLAIVNKLLMKKVNLIKKHEKHNLAIRHLMELLDSLEVESSLLKGQGLALNYLSPESREVGDIDVYIGEENMDSLVEKLKEMGHTCEEEINDTDKHVVFMFEDASIELHRDSLYLYTPKTNRMYRKWWNSVIFSKPKKAYIDENGKWFKEESVDSQCILLPETTLNVFFTFGHLLSHYMSFQFQFKQFIDLACLLKTEKDNIDLPLLKTKLNELGLIEPWQVICCYIHKNLGLPTDCIPFYNSAMERKAEQFGKQITESIFHPSRRSESKRPEGRIASKLYSYRLSFRAAYQTFSLFPKLTVSQFSGATFRGIRLLFNRQNRPQGTQEHYTNRKKSENNDN